MTNGVPESIYLSHQREHLEKLWIWLLSEHPLLTYEAIISMPLPIFPASTITDKVWRHSSQTK